ncbi:recombinase family protein [Streptacidiphilus jeojiense]|uniref:Recombinase family protein n=1 Tax=Streptacidiphilus cavernicola TaxID=3342716 RepID=A0ABV6UXF1_9ACTN|nr:recombinase family protein [Streptacidiphilus jeojiense]
MSGKKKQEEDCRRLADRLGVRVVGVYKDNDISASTRTKRKRKDYQRLLGDASTGFLKVVLAYTTSRITRKPRENEDLIELAEAHGTLFFYVASPDFDLNTASGRMIARILAAKDAGEAEETAERVARAALQRAEAGKFHGGGRPYGYEKDGVTLRDSEIEEYEEGVRRLIGGESQTAMVRRLNDRGSLTAEGALWTVGNLKRMFAKKRYVIYDDSDPEKRGTREHQTGEYRAEWPGVITRAEYELMMARFQQHTQPWAHGLSNGRKYLLSGLARCGGVLASGDPCGTAMYGQARKRDNGTSQRRYRCKGLDNHARQIGCGKVFRDAAALDEFVTEAVLYRLDSPEVARALASEQDTHQEYRSCHAVWNGSS